MGVSSFDILKANGIYAPQVMNTTGKVFFVNNATTGLPDGAIGGSNGNSGLSPLEPLSTIDYAVGLCAASRGDVIYVMPGHSETVTAAAGLALDVAGISVIGLGNARNRPSITTSASTAVTADVDFDAANIRLSNFQIDITGVDSIDAFLDVNSTDCQIDNCDILMADSGGQADRGVVLATGAGRFKFFKNVVDSRTAGAISAVQLVGTADGVVVADNYFYGDYSTATIENATGNVNTNIDINNNYIQNVNANDFAIELVSACTGVIRNNVLATDDPLTALDSGACICSGNRYQNTTAVVNTESVAAYEIPTTNVQRKLTRANYNFTADGGATSTISLYTVAGDIVCSVIGVCNTALTSGGAATIEVGVPTNTAILIAQATATDLIANEIWHDATPTTTSEAVDVFGGGKDVVITNGGTVGPIGFKITTATLTAGDIDFYCSWVPLSEGASVVAAI